MNKRALAFGVWMLPALGLGCGGEALDRTASESDPGEPSPGISSPSQERIMALNQDLLLGSTGDDVVAVHSYLTRYGYFPSEEIQRAFPALRPVVAEGPASNSIYDEHTIQAVKHYQTVYAIPVTGIVDAKTREMMRTPRCGWPDGVKSSDPSNKFAINGKYWGSQVNWLFKGLMPREVAQMKDRARNATYAWMHETSLHFTEIATGSYDMSITFGPLPCYPFFCDQNAWAITLFPDFTGNHSDIIFNSNKRWYFGTGAVPQDGLTGDFYSIALHEIGHAVGLDHSSLDGGPNWGTMMYPGISPGAAKRTLQVDDKVGVSSMYDQWQFVDGDTRDIGVGLDGEIWVVAASDNSVWKYENQTWYRVNASASRIAVGVNGWPYVIAGWGDGTIWKRPSNWRDDTIPPGWVTTVPWLQLPGGGCAKDIAVGADGVYPDWTDAIWVIGCDAGPDGTVWKFNGSGWTQVQSGGWGRNIAVGSDGRPWITNSAGEVFRYSSNDPWSGYWELITTPLNGSPAAVDIGVGAGNYPWITDMSIGGVYVLNKQPQIGGSDGAPWRTEWRALPAIGRSSRIAAGPKGEPWLVNTIGNIYKTLK